jgi:hypothetical protein
MKKIISVVLFNCITLFSYAQSADFRNVISFNVGANTFGLVSGDLGANAEPNEPQYKYGKFSNTPTFQLAWDYGITKWFSAGVAGSYNSAKYTFDNLEYNGKKIGTANLTANRTTLTTRLFLHYGNNNNWDFYTGGRIGVGLWSGRVSVSADEGLAADLVANIDERLEGYVPKFIRKRLLNDLGARAGFAAPSIQFVPIGVRGYFNDHIGLNAELAIGSPYYASAGVNYRF